MTRKTLAAASVLLSAGLFGAGALAAGGQGQQSGQVGGEYGGQQTGQMLQQEGAAAGTEQLARAPEDLSEDQIRQLEQALKDAGQDNVTVDGQWDEQTASALEQFREDEGIGVSIDDRTLQALDLDPSQFTTQQAQTPEAEEGPADLGIQPAPETEPQTEPLPQ